MAKTIKQVLRSFTRKHNKETNNTLRKNGHPEQRKKSEKKKIEKKAEPKQKSLKQKKLAVLVLEVLVRKDFKL